MTKASSTRARVLAFALVMVVGASSAVVAGEQAKKPADDKAPPPIVIDAGNYSHLQAAFDAVPETGGLVKLPPGQFELTEPLVLNSGDTRIEGHGAATHLINKNEEGKPALVLRPKALKAGSRVHIWRVQLADFRISGNPKSGDGLRAENINEIYIHGLSIDHNGGHGINLIKCTEDPRVADSILTYNGQAGLNIDGGHDIVVSANHFEENQDALICIDSFNLCMTGNNLDDHLGNGVVIENTYGSVLSGNMIEECKGIAVILDRDCYGITISANVIAHDFGGGVDLRDAWGCAVSANTFVLDGVHSLVIGPKSGRIAVTGNSFCNSHVGDAQRRKVADDKAHGVLLKDTSDITITGNTFTGLQDQAVRAEGKCRRLVVVGNVISDLPKGDPKGRPAVDLSGAQETLMENNLLPQP